MLIARTIVAALFAGLALAACGGNETSGDDMAAGAGHPRGRGADQGSAGRSSTGGGSVTLTIDHRLELMLNAKVNRFITVGLGGILLYDYDQDSGAQVSQVFNLGFAYSFQNYEEPK